MIGNVIIGQSGGPTAVINSSLAGAFRTACELGAKKVYGMLHGVKGLLEEEYIDLSEQIKGELEIELLMRTPSSYLGTCRYKLPAVSENETVYERIFEILKKLEIEVFLYIGGNDSMDTIQKLSEYGKNKGESIRFIGCPKTIDNDLAHTDHTPGFGSAAKYIGATMKEIIRDSLAMEHERGVVTVVEIMGRNAGWLTGAAALARSEDCEGADLIYLPELSFDIDAFLAKVETLLGAKHAVIVAVSEGICTADGKYVCESQTGDMLVDAFGHKQLSGTAGYLASLLGGKLGCKTRAIELSTLQRAASHLSSRVDVLEAYQAGAAAIKAAEEGNSAVVVVFERVSDAPYQCQTSLKDVNQIANDERLVPREWINAEGTYVTEEFIQYVKPLIQGEMLPIMVNGMPRHLIRK